MSDTTDNTQLNDSSRAQVPARGSSSRPPIQWPTRAPERSETDRDRATAYARQHVDRALEAEQKTVQPHIQPLEKRRPKHVQPLAQEQPNLAHQEDTRTTHTVQQEQHQSMRQEPYDWQQYHSAWQQYYHQYFYRYYAGWWQQQRAQIEESGRQQGIAAAQANQPQLSDRERVARELRSKVRSTVEKQSKRVKSNSHFKPIMASVTVGVLFLLLNYNQVLIGSAKQYIAPGSTVTTPVIVEPNGQKNVSADPRIIIPKIGVDAPVIYDEPRVDNTSYENALERGTVRLGNSANPGTKGNTVIGGHSSNNVFNPGSYKYVFVNLKKLDVGDVFYLNYNSVRYTYKVTVAKKVVPPTDVSALTPTDVPTVTLFTCDPPGTNINRLIVQAVQIDPDPTAATGNTNAQTSPNKSNPLPSVAPSIWDKLFN